MAAVSATTASMRLMPYHHTRGLLSTLRVFRGEDDDVRRVHVPLSVVIPYWSLLCGVSRSTSLFTVAALERDGSISLTKYDSGGSAEYWESTEDIEQVADVLLEHGGLHSLIPRLVQVGDASDAGSASEASSNHDADDAYLRMDLDAEGAGGSLASQRFVNTATAELRKVKEEMSRLQSSSLGQVDGEQTEVFMFPREAEAFRSAQRLAKAQQRRGSDSSVAHGDDHRSATPKSLPTLVKTAQPTSSSVLEETLPPPADLLARLDAVDATGVFVVLNARQYQDAVAVETDGVAVSVASHVSFGMVHDSAAPVSAFAALQALQQKEKLIFSSGCTDQHLHEVVVDAYRTMLRGGGADSSDNEQWALGPQDNYYYSNIEHHVRQAAYRFDMSLSWRIALLMNRFPSRFQPVFGEREADQPASAPQVDAYEGTVMSAAHSPPGDAFVGEAEGSLMGWLSTSAVNRVVPPYYLAALQDAQPSSLSTGKMHLSTPSPAAAASEGDEVAEELIPFLAKRCPLVALAAAKGERTLLQSTKKAALSTERSSSSARKSKQMSSASAQGGAAMTPPEDGFTVSVPAIAATSPYAASIGGLPSPRRATSVSSQSSCSMYAAGNGVGELGAAASSCQAATHFNAEPFQKMLDAALSAMSTFPSLLRVCVEGPTDRDKEIARFVLRACVVDMTDGQVALADHVAHYVRTQTHAESAMDLLEDTRHLHQAFVISHEEQNQLRLASTRLLRTMLTSLSEMMHAEEPSSQPCRNGQPLSYSIRTMFLSGHRLLFPGSFGQQQLLCVLQGERKRACAAGVVEYLQWLRTLRSIALCFGGTPIQPREDFCEGGDAEVAECIEHLYEWSVSGESPALRWASAFILHNRRRDEERCAFIDDVVYAYWERSDTVGIVHGIPQQADATIDEVQLVAQFVQSLSLDYVDYRQNDGGWGASTRTNWNVLPPRLQRAVRSGLVTPPPFMDD